MTMSEVDYQYDFQVIVIDGNTKFIENVIFIMKNILENKCEHPSGDHLGITSIESLMLAIVRYVRHLDSNIPAIQIKTKVCQLVDAVCLSLCFICQ
jgi:neurofibromin 1